MIEEHSIILTLAVKQTTFELERRTAPGLYGQKRGCGNATWGKLLGHTNHTFNAKNPINAGVMAEDDNQVDIKSSKISN